MYFKTDWWEIEQWKKKKQEAAKRTEKQNKKKHMREGNNGEDEYKNRDGDVERGTGKRRKRSRVKGEDIAKLRDKHSCGTDVRGPATSRPLLSIIEHYLHPTPAAQARDHQEIGRDRLGVEQADPVRGMVLVVLVVLADSAKRRG